jgi:exo-beta-1,3-glucanase (GH17 family)
MSHISKARLNLIFSLVFGISLSGLFLLGLPASQAAVPESLSLTPGYQIDLAPDQLTLTGDVATFTNTVGYCTHSQLLPPTPAGSLILGLDPTSCNPANWNGGSATAQIFLPAVYTSTVYVLKLSWPDQAGKGLHSPQPNKTATITLDGQPLWGKRTTQLSTFKHYYGAEHEPILTTMVVTQSLTHTLTFSVSAQVVWDLSQIELDAYPSPTLIRGIGYSPYRDCQSPAGVTQPSTQNIQEDLFRLYHTSNAIRTYAATGINSQIPTLANAQGLPVFAGAWLDYHSDDPNNQGSLASDDAEVQALINLAKTTNLAGVIVGNEYFLRSPRSITATNYLVNRLTEVRAGINNPALPLMTAEIENLMFDWPSDQAVVPTGINPVYRPVLDEVDFVLVHIYPFWSGVPIEGAAAFTVNRYKAIQALIEQEYPGQGKRVIIGEAGWPSAGAAYSPGGSASGDPPNVSFAVPSRENQRRYLLDFLPLADQNNVEYMYFDAFDELWKIQETGGVGQHWGYSYTDRTAKHDFYGLLLPSELLPPEPLFSYQVYLPYLAKTLRSSSGTTFPVSTEWPLGPGHFVPSGWMGNISAISMYECDRTNPHSGEMAVRVSFLPNSFPTWGGFYWQYPENNWGNLLPRGLNLTGADRVTFWARSNTPNAQVGFIIGGIGYNADYSGQTICSQPVQPYPDSVCPKIEQWVTLSSAWTKYTIDLHQNPRNLSKVIGGFGWVATSKVTFYLDDIVYESD